MTGRTIALVLADSLAPGRQQEAADFFGVTQAAVSRWAAGERLPLPKHLPKLAEWLGLPESKVREMWMREKTDGDSKTTAERLGEIEAGLLAERAARELLDAEVAALRAALAAAASETAEPQPPPRQRRASR